jgi:MFS family permease
MALVYAGANLAAPLWPLYRVELHLTNEALTIVFAAYTAGALVALFLLGGLSDVVGRRPILIASVAGTIASSLLFAFAQDIAWLLAARFIQGIAVGGISASANAALSDFAYRDDPRHPALAGSIATSAGFAIGPFSAGLFADLAPRPTHTVFFFLCAFAIVALIAVLRLPNSGRRPGAIYTGNRAAVPSSIRGPFVRAAFTFVVGWVGGAFFLALGPSIIAALLGTSSHTVAGSTLLVFFTASGAGQVIARRFSARNTLRCGAVTVVAGLFLAAVATLLHSLPIFFLAITIAGASQGIALLGGLALLNAIAPAGERGSVLSAFFLCGYVGVTVCAPLLGWVADAAGLNVAAISFATLIVVSGTIAYIDLTRWRPAPVPSSA